MTLEQRILDELATGKWHTLGYLSEALQVPHRDIEREVQTMRLAGHPLVTGPDGVHLSHDPAEVRATAMKLRNRALTQMVTAKALDDTADRLEAAPLTLFGRAA
ncbi:MAG TPA: hypothetical protein VFI40_11240 [Nocardioides sp.]|nr:hypothetical protein [Nocardioides sp.]